MTPCQSIEINKVSDILVDHRYLKDKRLKKHKSKFSIISKPVHNAHVLMENFSQVFVHIAKNSSEKKIKDRKQ